MAPIQALWSAVAQAAAIRNGKLKSRELLELFIDRIERLDGEVNAVVTRDFEGAREAADRADAAVASGASLGPLHGLPVTIKDALQTRGLRSTGGATELRDNVPALDAPVVKAVKEAGAIVFGKTNLPRWSGDIQAYNDIFGQTNNPWNREKVPGGSSGGAAAAVAMGFTAFEIGTDIGGSIRFPSAFCGVYGHKPSFGLVPSTGYLDHADGGTTEADVNVIGPITRSADDLRLVMEILMRREEPWTPQLAPAKPVGDLRIAAWLDDPFCPVDRLVIDRLEKVVRKLGAEGFEVQRDVRPDIDPRAASDLAMSLVGAATSESRAPTRFTHQDWLAAHREREEMRGRWRDFFEDIDVLLMPVAFVPPFDHQHKGDFATRTLECNGEARPYADVVRWTMLVGMAYLPVTVPPIGLTETGLPVGIQVVSRYGGDNTTIAFAETIGELMGGFEPPPLALG